MSVRHLAATALGVLAACGCVERTITIRTNPSGAIVHLNDEEIGRSPVTVPFLWYGDYDVMLRKEDEDPQTGQRTVWYRHDHRRTPQPWYQYAPFDLFAEAFMPFTIRDRHEWHFDLPQVPPADPGTLLDDALSLRARALGEPERTEEAPVAATQPAEAEQSSPADPAD